MLCQQRCVVVGVAGEQHDLDPLVDAAREHPAQANQAFTIAIGEGVVEHQRQRIGVARSLYSQPSLLILDEATSALDNETELRISETIQALHGSLTMIVVAHRLSTIRNCDRILFLVKGDVRAIGTFDELVQTDPDFANLARLATVSADDIFTDS